MTRTIIALVSLAAVLAGISGCDSSSDSGAPSGAVFSQIEPTPFVSAADKEKDIHQATDVLGAWLKLIDDGKYAEAWDQTDRSFKQSSPKDGWSKQTGAIRSALGPVLSRTLKEASFKTKMDNEPPGLFVTIHYDTAFKATNAGLEDITARRDSDGSWRALGYYVTVKPPTPTPIAGKH